MYPERKCQRVFVCITIVDRETGIVIRTTLAAARGDLIAPPVRGPQQGTYDGTLRSTSAVNAS